MKKHPAILLCGFPSCPSPLCILQDRSDKFESRMVYVCPFTVPGNPASNYRNQNEVKESDRKMKA